MHIAFLSFEYITETTFDGGLANYLGRVSMALMQRGHSVEIFTESTEDGTIVRNGITVHRIKSPEATVNWIRRVIRYSYSQDAVRLVPFALRFRGRVLKRHREKSFDIVQAPNHQSLGLGLVHFSPVPVVVRASSYQPYWRRYDRLAPYPFSRSTNLIDGLDRYMVRHAAAVYAPSELIANAFRRTVRPDVDVIHTPFSLDDVIPNEAFYREHLAGLKYLLFFGTLKVLKGGITMGDALKHLLPRIPDLHVVLVGKDTPIKDTVASSGQSVLQYICEQAGEHANRVHHFTRVRHEDLYPIIKGAAGVVLPSRIDNFPNACLEAMALGKVVIGTRGASFDEMMEDGVSGVLVPKDDPAALADAMGRVWQMGKEERAQIGDSAKIRVERLKPENTCRALEDYFGKIIGLGKRAATRSAQIHREYQ